MRKFKSGDTSGEYLFKWQEDLGGHHPHSNLTEVVGGPANLCLGPPIRKCFTAARIFGVNLIRLKDISLALWVTEYEMTPEHPTSKERTPS